jgi:hypothetical protein
MKNPVRAIPSALILICLPFLITITARLPSPYTITGDLHDDGGQLFPGATVCALQTNGKVVNVRDRVCAESDAQGKFVINLASSGRYQVVAEKMSEGYMPPYLPFYKDPNAPILEVMVSGENPNPSVSVKLGPKSGLISGKVIDEATDSPLHDFVVWTWQARDVNARTHEVVKGSPLGRFRILASPVPFRMRVVSEGYEDWVMGGGVLTSLAGSRKGPGSLLVRTGGNAEFAVYLKRKNPSPIDPAKAGDEGRLPAPTQLAPQDNQVFDVFPRNTKLEWSPVAGAVSYAVEIEACWNRLPVVRERLPDDGECINPSPYEEKFDLRDTTYEFFFKGAQPGRWRVWAIAKDRKQGNKSPWSRFTYLK